VQQQAVDLEIELAVEPFEQATRLGALLGFPAQQRRLGDLLLKMLKDRPVLADGQAATTLGLDQHRRQAGGIERGEVARPFPIAHHHIRERQALFAQHQANLA